MSPVIKMWRPWPPSDWFEITKEGFVTEKNIPALKESGLASTGKPSAAERMQQGIPSTSINLSDNRKIVNYFIIPSLQMVCL